jgi:hypothetical protein
MDALALFMIKLQAAKRKLLKFFDVSDGTFNEQRAHRMSKGLESVDCLTHIKTSWDVRARSCPARFCFMSLRFISLAQSAQPEARGIPKRPALSSQAVLFKGASLMPSLNARL